MPSKNTKLRRYQKLQFWWLSNPKIENVGWLLGRQEKYFEKYVDHFLDIFGQSALVDDKERSPRLGRLFPSYPKFENEAKIAHKLQASMKNWCDHVLQDSL